MQEYDILQRFLADFTILSTVTSSIMTSFTTNAVPSSQETERLHEGASTVQYEDAFEKANATLQVIWSTMMDESSYYKTPCFYKKVKCLLVSWDKACDDLHTNEEVYSLNVHISPEYLY